MGARAAVSDIDEATRKSVLQRQVEWEPAFHAADPGATGFVSLYDFRQVLYVDAALDYDTVMKLSQVRL